jgi:hypothetical protein
MTAKLLDLWRCDGIPFYCPVCGHEVCTDGGDPTGDPCAHLVFSWAEGDDEFFNPAPEVKRLLAETEQNEEDAPSPRDEEFLNMFPDLVVLFSFTVVGLPCCPACDTIIHAIEFPRV